jgi:hypothetical protein
LGCSVWGVGRRVEDERTVEKEEVESLGLMRVG